MTASRFFPRWAAFLGLAVGGFWPLNAVFAQQEILEPIITAVSAPSVVHLTKGDAKMDVKTITASETRSLNGHLVTVDPGQQVMIYSFTGRVVVVALGPAQFNVKLGEERIDFELLTGRLLAISQQAQDEQPVHLVVPAEGGPLAEGAVGTGWTFAERDGATVSLGYQGGAPAAFNVGGQAAALANGQRLILRDGKTETAALEAWLVETGFDARLGQRLGVASAGMSRSPVQRNFSINIIRWDQQTPAEVVIAALPQQVFRPEIRQTTSTITTQTTTVTSSSSIQVPRATAASNFPPVISPSGSSLGGIGTASLLQQNALTVLQNTQNRGFGFFTSPSRLVIPGLSGGSRAVGPAGLAVP